MSEIAPGSVTVERSTDPMRVICAKGNYYTAEAEVESHLSPGHSILNVFNGIFPGAIYDTASGAIYAYPREIKIPMVVDPVAVAAASDGGPQLVQPLPRKEDAEVYYPGEHREKPDSAAPSTTPPGEAAVEETLNNALGQ